jgi:hypothetical protein
MDKRNRLRRWASFGVLLKGQELRGLTIKVKRTKDILGLAR